MDGHVTYGAFGRRMLHEPGPVDMLAESVKGGIDPWKRQLALRELYETLYRICDHTSPENAARPLALVAMHPKENTTAFSPLMHRLDEYMSLRLFEKTGVPLDRFLEMPADYVREVIEIAKRQIRTEGEVVSAAGRKLDQTTREIAAHTRGKP